MLMDITSHPLLTGKATAMSSDSAKFEAQQSLAEALLNLTAEYIDRLSIEQLARASMAVVLQVNFQLEQGLDPFVVSRASSTQQGEVHDYRGDAVHPQARAILDAIVVSDEDLGYQVAQFAAIPAARSVRRRY